MKPLAFVLAPVLLLGLVRPIPAQDVTSRYEKVHKIEIGGEGGWDFLEVDAANRQLYVTRGTRVVVVDLDTEKVVGQIDETPGVHGVAFVPDLGRGFTSNGGDSTVTVFDTKSLTSLETVKANGRPDIIYFEPVTRRVFTFNHGTNDTTAINPAEMKAVGSLALGGVPELAVSDEKGHIFVNLEDTSEIVEFDAATLKILKRFPLAPGDRAHRTGVRPQRAKALQHLCQPEADRFGRRQRQGRPGARNRPGTGRLRLRCRNGPDLCLERRRRHTRNCPSAIAGKIRSCQDGQDTGQREDARARSQDAPHLPFSGNARSDPRPAPRQSRRRRVGAAGMSPDRSSSSSSATDSRNALPLIRRRRPGRGVSRDEPHRPLHHLEPHLLDLGPLPDFLGVAEAVVEHSAFAIFARPDDREVLAMDASLRQVELARVQAHEDSNIFA